MTRKKIFQTPVPKFGRLYASCSKNFTSLPGSKRDSARSNDTGTARRLVESGLAGGDGGDRDDKTDALNGDGVNGFADLAGGVFGDDTLW